MTGCEFQMGESKRPILDTQEDNTKAEGIKVATKGTSDFSQWGTFIWKLFRSLALIVAGATLVYFICRWLIK